MAACLALLGATAAFGQEQERFESLIIGGNIFSNVTVMSRSATHLSFKHAHGFATVKLTDLPARDQTKVGFTPPPPPKTLKDRGKELTEGFAEWFNDPRLKALEKDIRAEVDRVLTEDDTVIIRSVLAGVVCIYLLFCLAVIKICQKTTVRPGLYVWLPGFQWISLLKAAGMSPWNFLLLLIPPINLIVMTVWCFRICRMRQKSGALGFLLLIPVVQIFVFFYLALSSHKTEQIASRRDPGKLKISFQH